MELERQSRDAALADMGLRLAAQAIRARRRQYDIFVTAEDESAAWDGPAVEAERERLTPSAEAGARPAIAAVLRASVSGLAQQVQWQGLGTSARRMAALSALGTAGFGLVMFNAKPTGSIRPHTHHAASPMIAEVVQDADHRSGETTADDGVIADRAEAGGPAVDGAAAQASPAAPAAAPLVRYASTIGAGIAPAAAIQPAAAAHGVAVNQAPAIAGAAEVAPEAGAQGASSGNPSGTPPGTPPRTPVETAAQIINAPDTESAGVAAGSAKAPVVPLAAQDVASLPDPSVQPRPRLAIASQGGPPKPMFVIASARGAHVARAALPTLRPAFAAQPAPVRPAPVLLVRAMARRSVAHHVPDAPFDLPRWLTQPQPATPHVLIMSPQPHMLQDTALPPPAPPPAPASAPAPHPVPRPQYWAPVYANYYARLAPPPPPSYYGYPGYYPQSYYPN